MSNSRGPGPIPNRWLRCPRKSETIIAEHFIAFKTPLSAAFHDQMDLQYIFKPEMIFSWCQTVKLKLGLWIDLTNTKRFYDRRVVESHGAQYVKLQCRGHGETPSKEQTQSFIQIVDDFMKERPFDMIGVHCTHGFNRTGFLIVSYLVERLDMSVEAAISVFAASRPPGIYKQDYIDELFQRYESDETPLTAPDLPDWCFDHDDSEDHTRVGGVHSSNSTGQKRGYDNFVAQSSTSQAAVNNGAEADNWDEDDGNGDNKDDADFATGGGKARKRRRRELVIKNATFMEGVSNVFLVTDQPRLGELQRKVQDMCGWEKSGFPGAQPVSMDRNNLKLLQDMSYRVSWKADGTRYMMLINKKDEIYFFDRNHSCFEVKDMTFLRAGNLNEHLEDTLVDGEMVIDKYKGVCTPRYLIYDIVKISNKSVGNEIFPNRLRCIRKEIIEPRHEAIVKGIIRREREPFGLRLKDFWEIRQAASLLGEKFARSLLHEPDGLIFQPTEQPYMAGVCPNVLKWKPHELNSVDFRLKIVTESGRGIVPKKVGVLFVGGHDAPFDKIAVSRTLKELDNKIIECTVNKQGQWVFLRERTDKTLPNSYKTAAAVCESIRHPVTKEILLDFIEAYGYRDDNNMMPPPATHHVQRAAQQHYHHPTHHQHQQHQQQKQQQFHQQRSQQQKQYNQEIRRSPQHDFEHQPQQEYQHHQQIHNFNHQDEHAEEHEHDDDHDHDDDREHDDHEDDHDHEDDQDHEDDESSSQEF